MDPQNQAPNNPNGNPPGSQNPGSDLNQQYQDILNKYAQELDKISQEPPVEPPVLDTNPPTTPSPVETTPVSSSDSFSLPTPPAPSPSLSDELSAMLDNDVSSKPVSDLSLDTSNPTDLLAQVNSSQNELASPATGLVPDVPEIQDLSTYSLPSEPSLNPEPLPSTPQPEDIPISPPASPPVPETLLPPVSEPEPAPTTDFPNITPPPTPPTASIPTPQFDSLAPPMASKPTGGIFKVLFFISLIVFVIVSGILAYTFVQNQNTPSDNQPNDSQTGDISPADSDDSQVCELNDKKYKIGESFAAADGCNTCSCEPDLTIACTEKDCSSAAEGSQPAVEE